MSDDKDKKAPEGEEERTVFMPSGGEGETPAAPKGNFFETDDAPPSPPAAPGAPPAEPTFPPSAATAAEAEAEAPVEAPAEAAEAAPAESPAESEATAEPVPDTEGEEDASLSDPEPPTVDATASDPEPSATEPAEPATAEEPRTVFAPSPVDAAPSDPEPSAPEPAEPAPAEEPRTVFAPSPVDTPAPAAEAPASPPPPPPASVEATAAAGAATSSGTAGPAAFIPVEGARNIKVGDCLNHIFEVKRFLARGGMGEVFEGCNVNTDERVAIKVMLPAMAADEKVVALFRKEARTLTKLQHEALVSYRVLAQEPQLGVLYIVTEFIEGVNLSEALGTVERTPDELAGLLRRLASGLGYAHRLGAVHRDLSPDNVLLPGGDVHQAKIIDFGIAKDLDASSATIVGDGFAGKLNYVAPEQLGDYGREVGPWTDVYSLALVILAVAQGKSVNMSGSLVDAIDKRRKGPDLAAVPGSLRPVLEAMLRPDPKERLRSMEDVVKMLGGERVATPSPPPPPPPPETKKQGSSATPALIGGLVAVGVLAAAGAWYAFGGIGQNVEENKVVPVVPGNPAETARNAINAALPSVGCTWLDISSIENRNGALQIALRGVAGEGDAARQEISRALTDANIQNAQLDFGDVAPITQAGCAALDAYRQVRATAGTHLSVGQPRFEMMMQPAGLPYAGEQASNAAINFNLANAQDFAILGIEPSGVISPLIADRATFQSALTQSVDGRPITDEGNGRYRLNIDLNHDGWSGIILVTGQGPFERDLVAPPVGSRGPSWRDQFLARAADRNWRVEMVWFESVNNVTGDSAPPPAAATPPAAPPAPPQADSPAADSADDDKPPEQ